MASFAARTMPNAIGSIFHAGLSGLYPAPTLYGETYMTPPARKHARDRRSARRAEAQVAEDAHVEHRGRVAGRSPA